MAGVSPPTTAVAEHSPREPRDKLDRVSRQELGFVAQLVPGRAVAPIYISAQSKRGRFSLTGKSRAPDSARSRLSKGSPRTPKRGAERAVSRQTADQRIGRRALAGQIGRASGRGRV